MRGPALQHEAQLKVGVRRLQALVRLREQQLFGRKAETAEATAPAAPECPRRLTLRRPHASNPVGRPRRRNYFDLPALSRTRSSRRTSAIADGLVSRSATFQAPKIPLSWRSMSGPIAESFAVAVIDRLARGRPSRIVTAPPPDRLIPKSMLGISIWVTILLDKYLFYRPTYRLLADSQPRPGPVVGHLTDGLSGWCRCLSRCTRPW